MGPAAQISARTCLSHCPKNARKAKTLLDIVSFCALSWKKPFATTFFRFLQNLSLLASPPSLRWALCWLVWSLTTWSLVVRYRPRKVFLPLFTRQHRLSPITNSFCLWLESDKQKRTGPAYNCQQLNKGDMILKVDDEEVCEGSYSKFSCHCKHRASSLTNVWWICMCR